MSKPVPQVALIGRHIPASIFIGWSCHCCDYRCSARSEAEIQAAMDDHAAYVNRTKDRATDPHFAISRMDVLLGQ